MKKLLLLSAILIISLKSFSQESYNIVSVAIADYNSYTEKYVWGDYEDTEMTMTIKGNVMFISDEAKSVYIMGKKIFENSAGGSKKQIAWKARDEGNRSCTIKMATYTSGSFVLYVIYTNKAFAYTIEKQ